MIDHPVCSEWDSVREMGEAIFREASFFCTAFHQNNLPTWRYPVSIHISDVEPWAGIVIHGRGICSHLVCV
jgi:hypothetical protein